MDEAMNRLTVGAVLITLSLLLPTSGQAYSTADEPKTVLAKSIVAVQIAANTKKKKPANVNANAGQSASQGSPKGGVELLESLKKARKEKGGGN